MDAICADWNTGVWNIDETCPWHTDFNTDSSKSQWDPAHVWLFGRCKDGKSVAVKVLEFNPWLVYSLRGRSQSSVEQVLDKELRCNDLRCVVRKWPGMAMWEPDIYGKQMRRSWLQVCFPSIYMRQKALGLKQLKAYEGSFSPVDQCLTMLNLQPGGWVTVVAAQVGDERGSSCNLEFCTTTSSVFASCREDMAPLRILSFDLECFADGAHFPSADRPNDKIMVIGVHQQRWGESNIERHQLVVCAGAVVVTGVDVRCFSSEAGMLHGFRALVHELDPDVVIGYNTTGFDYAYLSARAIKFAPQSLYLGRLPLFNTKLIQKQMGGSKQPVSSHMKTPGRSFMDLYSWAKKELKLPSLSLNTVSAHLLKDTKVDLPIVELMKLLKSGDACSMRKVIEYCVQDCDLPLRIMEKRQLLMLAIEMSRVSSTLLVDLETRG